MRISVFDTQEQIEFKTGMLQALAAAQQLFPANDVTFESRGNRWCEMALWLTRYDCLMADVYSPEDVMKQAQAWAWEMFMDADQEGTRCPDKFKRAKWFPRNHRIFVMTIPSQSADYNWLLFQEVN